MKRRNAVLGLATLLVACGGSTEQDGAPNPWPKTGCPPSHEMVGGKCTVREVFVPGGTFVLGRGYCPEAGVLADPVVLDDCPLADAPRTVTVAPFWVDATVLSHDGPGDNCPSAGLECATPNAYMPVQGRHGDSTPDGFPQAPPGTPTLFDLSCAPRGKRQLTEVEWEFIATWGGTREYPWGDREPTCADANIDATNCPPRNPVQGYPDDHPLSKVSKVASYPPSPEGIYDLIGNLPEQVKASPEVYGDDYTAVPIKLPVCFEKDFPCNGGLNNAPVVAARGGAADGALHRLRPAYRDVARPDYYGFPARCARSAE